MGKIPEDLKQLHYVKTTQAVVYFRSRFFHPTNTNLYPMFVVFKTDTGSHQSMVAETPPIRAVRTKLFVQVFCSYLTCRLYGNKDSY